MFWEVIFQFPKGVKNLLHDLRIYKLIHDAKTTPNNAWTGRPFTLIRSNESGLITQLQSAPGQKQRLLQIHYFITVHSKIPRHQQEFQRRLKRDLRKVLLPVLAYTFLPIVGNLFLLLPAIAPRLFTSRHFLQNSSIKALAVKEYNLRKLWYTRVARDFWLSSMKPMARDEFYLDCINYCHPRANYVDDNVPTSMNIIPLLNLLLPLEVLKHFGLSSISTLQSRYFVSIDTLSSSSLYDLARSHGITSSDIYLQFVPNAFLRKRLLSIAHDILDDDILLIQANEHFNECHSLTDEEVLDACLLRGLSIDTILNMRTDLSHHLRIVHYLLIELIQIKSATTNDHISVAHQFNEELKKAVLTFVLFLPSIIYDVKVWASSTCYQEN